MMLGCCIWPTCERGTPYVCLYTHYRGCLTLHLTVPNTALISFLLDVCSTWDSVCFQCEFVKNALMPTASVFAPLSLSTKRTSLTRSAKINVHVSSAVDMFLAAVV